MPRFYFALDLRNDPVLIEEYERWHRPEHIWPTTLQSLRSSGIEEFAIYRCGNRLVQVLQVAPGFSLEENRAAGSTNPNVLAWEEFMWQFQQALPFAPAGQKWVPMARVFSLRETLGETVTESRSILNTGAAEPKSDGC